MTDMFSPERDEIMRLRERTGLGVGHVRLLLRKRNLLAAIYHDGITDRQILEAIIRDLYPETPRELEGEI